MTVHLVDCPAETVPGEHATTTDAPPPTAGPTTSTVDPLDPACEASPPYDAVIVSDPTPLGVYKTEHDAEAPAPDNAHDPPPAKLPPHPNPTAPHPQARQTHSTPSSHTPTTAPPPPTPEKHHRDRGRGNVHRNSSSGERLIVPERAAAGIGRDDPEMVDGAGAQSRHGCRHGHRAAAGADGLRARNAVPVTGQRAPVEMAVGDARALRVHRPGQRRRGLRDRRGGSRGNRW